MSEFDDFENENESEDETARVSFLGKYFFPVVIVAIGVGVAWWLIFTKPKAVRKRPEASSRFVTIQTAETSSYQVKVPAMGTIIPSHKINIQSRVSGQIIRVHDNFESGGFFKKGDVILKIDPVDYKAALEQKRAQLSEAELNYKLELGKQNIAKREWEMLGDKKASKLEQELTLRKPHLEQMKSALDAAKSTFEKAKLDLERTEIKAPFNCIISSKSADLGAQVTSQTVLAEIIGGDSVYALVSIPVDYLKWLKIPDEKNNEGSEAEIRVSGLDNGHNVWHGKIIRQKPDLEEKGRMAQLLIEITLGLEDKNKLLIGSYVNVLMNGSSLENVFVLPRKSLRDGGNVWLFEEKEPEGDENSADGATRINGTLQFRKIGYVWKDANNIVINEGLEGGEKYIASDISTPVIGIPLWAEKAQASSENNNEKE